MKLNKYLSLVPVALVAALILVWAPPPRPAQAQFVAQQTYAGLSGGTANAQTIALGNVTAMSQITGVPITFTASVSNTASATLNLNSLGAVVLNRFTDQGNVVLSGQELLGLVTVVYDGAKWNVTSPIDLTPIGSIKEFRGANTPRGYLIEDGSCVSRTTYAPLFTAVGTTYGACDGSTTFAVPDSRGTMFAALDNQGVNGSAGRITSASGCTGTAVGLCGAQTHALSATELPNISQTFTGSFSGTAGGVSVSSTLGGVPNSVSVTQTSATIAATGINLYTPGNASTLVSTGSFTPAGTIAGAISAFGGNVAHTILNPILLGRRAIKY